MDIEAMPVRARIRSMLPSLQTAERRVAEYLLQHEAEGGDLTVSAVAAGAGASAGTVVRTCKSLGYQGYQQVRVLLARDSITPAMPAAHISPVAQISQISQASQTSQAASGAAHAPGDCSAALAAASAAESPAACATHAASASDRIATDAAHEADHAVGSRVISHAAALASSLPTLMSMLSPAELDDAVQRTLGARRVLVIASGLSAPIGQSFVSRLIRCGIDAIAFSDVIDQHIAAQMTDRSCVVYVISGSGVNAHTLAAARAAKRSGAGIIAMSYFAASALSDLADTALIIEPPDLTFGEELRNVSRVALMVLAESLATEIERAANRSRDAFTAISQHLEDSER